MPEENIADTSRPNAGRIYDYLLGGSHNFGVDRSATEELIRMVPFLPKAMRLQRWCLQDIAVELTEQYGFDIIIDFASGLPTNDHIHEVVRPSTTVIYSDYDPVVVEYANDILAEKELPNVYAFRADARHPEELLNRPEVEQILAGRRRVGFVLWGVAMFLDDAAIAHSAQFLYEWSSPDSVWAFQAQGAVWPAPQSPEVMRTNAMYEQMGSPMTYRSLDMFSQLIKPWHPDERGFVSLVNWHNLDLNAMDLTPADRAMFGSQGGNLGAYLVK
jgi:hypothetical protein